MKCPSCHAAFTTPVAECPECRLTLRQLDIKFGALPRHSRFFTDRTRRLPLRAIRELRDLLGLFVKKFPESLFSVFIIDRVVNGTIAEYTFWLANRARFSSLEAADGNNFDLLLGIDAEGGAAALVVGYGLENYLTEGDLQSALAEADGAFHAHDFPRGIRNCVEFMTNRMRDVAKGVEETGSPRELPAMDLEI